MRCGAWSGESRKGHSPPLSRSAGAFKVGAEQVAELWQTDPATIFYPKGDKLPLLDVLYRALTIDCWIELQRFAEAGAGEVEFFHPYFRTTGANRDGAERGTPLRKLTRIDLPPELARKHKKLFFWPDAAFILRTSPEAAGAGHPSASSAYWKSIGASTPRE